MQSDGWLEICQTLLQTLSGGEPRSLPAFDFILSKFFLRTCKTLCSEVSPSIGDENPVHAVAPFQVFSCDSSQILEMAIASTELV